MTKLRLLGIFSVITLIIGCASSPGGKSAQNKARVALNRGDCPEFIVYPGARSEFAQRRYGNALSTERIGEYRDREIANCEARLLAGDANAMATLTEYWYTQRNPQNIARSYKAYLHSGSDVDTLRETSEALYRMYGQGEKGMPRNPEAAFHYLDLAIEYGARGLELPYADALHSHNYFEEAFAYYIVMPRNPQSIGAYGTKQVCEVNLKLADMYFRGHGVKENWYVGYYYWLQGLSLASTPDSAACTPGKSYDDTQPHLEPRRKQAVDARIDQLGSSELQKVESAWRSMGMSGLPTIAAIKFRRPLLPVANAAPDPRPVKKAYSADTGNGSAPTVSRHAVSPRPAGSGWQPLDAAVCQLQPARNTLAWSDLFKLRSGSIWAVHAVSGNDSFRGSAVAVSRNTLVTNCHVVNSPGGIILRQAGRSIRANIASADIPGDRCILQTAETIPTYVASGRGHTDLLVGEELAAIGNPNGLSHSLSRGIVAQKRSKGGRAHIQTDAAISKGSSGGGLFDHAGNLVGITSFKVATGENLNFAIAIKEFCRN